MAPRPRVALINLNDDEREALAEFFPTAHFIDSVYHLNTTASAAELDMIVSACASNLGVPSELLGYERCHLILLGPTAWLDQLAPASVPGRYRYRCDRRAQSNQYTITDDLDPRLVAAVSASLPERALGLPIIQVCDHGLFQTYDDPRRDGWLAWALDPEAPIAVNVYRQEYNSWLAWFPSRPTNCAALVKALCHVWAPNDRDAFPTIVEWGNSAEWMSLEEQALREEQLALRSEMDKVTKTYQEKLAVIDRRFEAAKDAAEAGPRAILSTQDDALVDAVHRVFEELGFTVTNVDKTRDPKLAKREDLQLRLSGVTDDWVAIVEVKGHKKRGANDEDLTKIERHVRNYLNEVGRVPSLKIYVCNSQFSWPPDARQVPYAGSTSADDFCDDPKVPGIIIPTPDLFRLHRDRIRLGTAEARRLLLATCSVFKYPAR